MNKVKFKDIFQVTRVYENRRRNCASWEAKQRETDNVWLVHFVADYVPRADWLATNTTEIMQRIEIEMNAWVRAVDERMVQYEKKSPITDGTTKV